MKKSILFALILVLGFGFVACQNTTTAPTTQATTAEQTTTGGQTTSQVTTDQTTTDVVTTDVVTTEEEDTVGPVFSGVEDVTIYVDDVYTPLTGVTANDAVDGDVTSSITYAGVLDTSATGRYYIIYTVYDEAGNMTQASRYITVEVDPSLIGDELVQNGDFSLGWAIWHLTTGNEGGMGTATVNSEEQLEVDVTSVSAGLWEPRLESNVIEFVNGTTYEITFDAKADAPRSIHIQLGQILPAAPWFVNYKPGQTEIFDLGTDWQTYSFKFTMNAETGDGQLLFEMGTVEGEVGVANLLTTIYYDNIAIVESTPDEDVDAPVFSGVDDVTIESGSSFDPLDGVTAFDVRDGEITLDSTNVTGTVNTEVPGDYTLTYTVTDEAGNTETVDRIVTVVDLLFNETDLVVNGDFAAALGDPAEWYIYKADWVGADGSVSIINEELVLSVVNAGDHTGYYLQAIQDIDFQVGQTYKIVFDAKADAARVINFAAGFSDAGYGWHGVSQTFTLTTEYQTYEYIFTVNEDNAEYVESLKFEFAQADDTVYLDNVALMTLESPTSVVNSDMSDIGWYTWAQNWGAVGGIEISIVDGELVANVTAISEQNWSVQLFQEGLVLVPGTTYTITFDAKSDIARDINLKLITYSAPNVVDTENAETFMLTTEMATYTFTFTYNGTQTTGKIDFELGNISASSVATAITFDNIAMTDGTTPVAIVNSDFAQTVGWSTWSYNGSTSVAIVDEELVVNVPDIGSAFWNSQLFQDGIELVPGATYTIAFQAMADVARDMNVVLIAGGEYRQHFMLSTEMQTFYFTFVYDGTATSGKLDFEFGAIGTDSAAAVITMDNIMMYRTFTPVDAGPNLSGVEDVTIEEGATFDPLAGVTAFDWLEGAITVDSSNVSGTVDANTVGVYTLTYTVSDEAGNETVVERVVTVVSAATYSDAGLVVNGDFSSALGDPAEWYLYKADWAGADGSLAIANEELVLTVVNPAGYTSYYLQAIQDMDFVVGETYKVVFDAKADADRIINFAAGFADASYGWHGVTHEFSITTSYQTYELVFTVTEDNASYVESLKFEFAQADATVYLDNIEVLVQD